MQPDGIAISDTAVHAKDRRPDNRGDLPIAETAGISRAAAEVARGSWLERDVAWLREQQPDVLAGLRAKRRMRIQRRRLKGGSRRASAPAIPTEPVGVAQILREVLSSEPELSGSFARIKFALADELRARLDPFALGRILSELIGTARLIGPSAEVLLTARSQDGCIEMSAVIDRPIGSAAAVERAINATETLAALYGGTVAIDRVPNCTIIRVRLLERVGPAIRLGMPLLTMQNCAASCPDDDRMTRYAALADGATRSTRPQYDGNDDHITDLTERLATLGPAAYALCDAPAGFVERSARVVPSAMRCFSRTGAVAQSPAPGGRVPLQPFSNFRRTVKQAPDPKCRDRRVWRCRLAGSWLW